MITKNPSTEAPRADLRRPVPGGGAGGRALLLLNAALLAVLAWVSFTPGADAQIRARGDYTMVAGRVAGLESSAVYIVDTTNQEMVVLTYSTRAQNLEGIAYRNLATDAAGLTGGGNPTR